MPSDWVVLQPSLKPLEEKIEPIIEPVISVIDVIIAVLNITQKVLNIIKAFLIGILDPLKPLVERIIAEIKTLIRDLRQLGLYLHGDWDLFTPSDYFSDLVGGYEVYERRMLQRLLDPSDTSRPNFSSNSAVIALFIYITSGDVALLIKLIQEVLKFFGQGNLAANSAPYATPLAPEILFSSENFLGAQIFVETDELKERPEFISISWSYPQGGGIPFLNSPAPQSYRIHVSTLPEGFNVIYTQPKDDTSKKIEDLPLISGVVIDPITNKPLKLYGGLNDATFPASSDDPRAPKVLLSAGKNTPLIKPEVLENNGEKIFGKSFVVNASFFSKLAAGTPITAILPVEELPKTADIINVGGFGEAQNVRVADQYYIRIRANAEPSSGKLKNPAEASPIYDILQSEIRNSRSGAGIVYASVEGTKNYTDASSPSVAKVPSDKLVGYQKAVQAALAILILCRADLEERQDENDTSKNKVDQGYLTGLEAVGRPVLLKYGIDDSLYKEQNPLNFRKKVLYYASKIQADLQKLSTPPDSVLDALSEEIKTLTEDANLEGQTVHEALEDKNPNAGVSGNPFSQGTSRKVLQVMYARRYAGPSRKPSFYMLRTNEEPFPEQEGKPWMFGDGSCDLCPIYYGDGPRKFIRNYLIEEKELINASKKILSIAGVVPNVKDKGWIALRLMPEAFPEADAILENLEKFLQAILDSLTSIADAIIAIIESIQARIYQLQGILELIKALLESLSLFSLPGLGGLLLVENGTSGIVSGLLSSGNKPISSPTDYSAGVVLVAGGLPQLLLDIIEAILGGEE